MLEHTDELLTVFDADRESESEQVSKPSWDYRAALKYQENHDYQVTTIDFDELQEAAVELNEEQNPDY